jgi:hypothetical protein
MSDESRMFQRQAYIRLLLRSTKLTRKEVVEKIGSPLHDRKGTALGEHSVELLRTLRREAGVPDSDVEDEATLFGEDRDPLLDSVMEPKAWDIEMERSLLISILRNIRDGGSLITTTTCQNNLPVEMVQPSEEIGAAFTQALSRGVNIVYLLPDHSNYEMYKENVEELLGPGHVFPVIGKRTGYWPGLPTCRFAVCFNRRRDICLNNGTMALASFATYRYGTKTILALSEHDVYGVEANIEIAIKELKKQKPEMLGLDKLLASVAPLRWRLDD